MVFAPLLLYGTKAMIGDEDVIKRSAPDEFKSRKWKFGR